MFADYLAPEPESVRYSQAMRSLLILPGHILSNLMFSCFTRQMFTLARIAGCIPYRLDLPAMKCAQFHKRKCFKN